MKRIYLDSNVFISVFESEIGKGLRGLFVEVENFLEEVKEKNHVLILSDWFFKEIEKRSYLSKNDVLEILAKSGVIIETVAFEQFSLAEIRKTGMHFSDAIHAITAIKSKCDCIVTFNVKDFEKINSKINVFAPNEFT